MRLSMPIALARKSSIFIICKRKALAGIVYFGIKHYFVSITGNYINNEEIK